MGGDQLLIAGKQFQKLDVIFPLGVMTVVTGVSGSENRLW